MPVGTEVPVPDYSACSNKTCDRRLECARYRMRWSMYQSVGEFESKDCTYFMGMADPPFHVVTEEEADAR